MEHVNVAITSIGIEFPQSWAPFIFFPVDGVLLIYGMGHRSMGEVMWHVLGHSLWGVEAVGVPIR